MPLVVNNLVNGFGRYMHPGHHKHIEDCERMRNLMSERYMKDPAYVGRYIPKVSRKKLDGTSCGDPAAEQRLYDYDMFVKKTMFVPYTAKIINSVTALLTTKKIDLTGAGNKPLDDKVLRRAFDRMAPKAIKEFDICGRVGILATYNERKQEPEFTVIPSENILLVKDDGLDDEGNLILTDVVLYHVNVVTYDNIEIILTNYFINDSNNVVVQTSTQLITTYNPAVDVTIDRQHLYGYRLTLPNVTWSDPVALEIRGMPATEIPFTVIPLSDDLDVIEEPVYSNVGYLNIHHFRESNDYAVSKFVNNAPIFAINKDYDKNLDGIYSIDRLTLWFTGEGSSPVVLQSDAQGLKITQEDLRDLEKVMSLLSSQILLNRDNFKTSDGEHVRGQKELVDTIGITQLAEVLSAGLTQALRKYMKLSPRLQGQRQDATVTVHNIMNQTTVGPAEIASMIMLYERGLIGLEEIYNLMRNSNWLPKMKTFTDFEEAVAKDRMLIRRILEAQTDAQSQLSDDPARPMQPPETRTTPPGALPGQSNG